MEQDDILNLVSSLKISDEEDSSVVVLDRDVCNLGKWKLSSCLACKVLSSKTMPREVIRKQVLKILQLVGNVIVDLIGNNLFIMEFSSQRDQKRVLTNGPWNLFRNLLIFTKLHENSKISSLVFDSQEIWVQIHNIPLACMNRECAEILGNNIGNLVEVAVGDKGDCWGWYLRLKIAIDISKPLKRVVRLCLREGEAPEMLLLQYERLPNLCYRCGLLGHSSRECLAEAMVDEAGKEILKFEPWMLASSGVCRPKFNASQAAAGGNDDQ
ncbi:hypothetical protein UlMin_018403 [Ulmus minor]